MCAFAPDLYSLCAGRLVQALSVSATLSVGRSIVRDCFPSEQMAQVYAYVGTALALGPIVGPIFGGFIEVAAGWRSVFFFLAGVGGVILALFTSGAYPEWAFWAQSGEAIFMIMLGGLNVFLGPILGAVVLRILNDVVQMYTSHTEIVIGAVIMFVVLGLRRGILDFVKDWWVERQQARLSAENRNGKK